jgi:predicted GNAT superfamily acetyltransferase
MPHQSLEIRRGSYKEALFNMPLLASHWDELVKRKDLFVVNGDYDRYEELEKSGKLINLLAFCDEELVGYSINILSTHLHYKDVLICYNDLLFVHPDKRNSPLGLKLIKKTEENARIAGAELMMWHAKVNSPLDKILPRLGNSLHENIYLKEL